MSAPLEKQRYALVIDLWLRDIAPSPDLRRCLAIARIAGQDIRPSEPHPDPELRRLKADRVTLVYAAKDEARNHARVLLDRLRADGGKA